MEQFKDLLENRKKYLLQLDREKENAMDNAPQGFLRICNGRKKAQYYHRTDPKDFSGVYICEKYEKMNEERRKLIEPIQETDEQYIANWEKVKYYGKEFEEGIPKIYTAKGERVRSKSEVIIADSLSREGIPYRYEYPVKIKGWGNFYPDFTALNVRERKEIYWEHLGMMDDITYVENALQKITLYMENGIFTVIIIPK